MTLPELRYYFEHQFAPNQFLHNTVPFLFELIGDGGEETRDIGAYVYHMFLKVAQKEDVSVTYSLDDFRADLWDLDDGDYMLRIDMPEPQENPQCKTIFLLFNTEFSHLGYFTLELLEKKWRRKRYVLCEWTADEHSNYGFAPKDADEIEKMVVNLFRQN